MTHDFGDLCAIGYDTSPAGRDRALAILARLEPYDVAGLRKIRVGRDHDGGYVMIDDFAGIGAAYSLGISDDVSWDLGVAERGIVVHQYDHTVAGPPSTHPCFRFHRVGIAAEPAADGTLATLTALVAANAADDAGADLVLKCDIEGAEWAMLAGLEPELLRRFRQIVIELHGLRDLGHPGFAPLAAEAVRRLTADHRVVHVHGNNYAGYAIVGGVPVPTVLELTLVRAAGRRLIRPRRPFPTPLDQPNDPGRADHALGMFRFR